MRQLIFCLLLLPLAQLAVAESPHRCAADGIAMGGYDLVSYYQASGPLPGLEEYEAQHDGMRYRFINDSNRAAFLVAPAKYLPRYRGWCAATLSMGRLTCPDYANYKIEDGQLLLFELAGFTNGRTLWNSDPAGFRQRADQNALKLLSP